MKEKLYQMMDWAAIEGIVYSEEDRPGNILGPHPEGSSTLVQAFFPEADRVVLVLEEKNKRVTMEQADEAGFFAASVLGKKIGSYHYEVRDREGHTAKRMDPYAFMYTPAKEELDKFRGGIHYELYKLMGSHKTTVDGVEGMVFVTWQPNALRVSIVGEFNRWDGRVYPMNRIEGTDIFTLFFPGMDEQVAYQYEVKSRGDRIALVNDLFALWETEGEKTVSVPYRESTFSWEDRAYISKRSAKISRFAVYECGEEELADARTLAERVSRQGFTHVALPQSCPEGSFYRIPDYFTDAQAGKQFVNELHKAGIGVLFNWQADLCRDLGQKQICNCYIADVLYRVEEYHIDGVIFSNLEALLYLDYGKQPGQWQPNIYGGNENLEAVEFIKHTNSILGKRNNGILLLADLDAIWPRVTDSLAEGGLGFTYRYDTDFTKEFTDYLTYDPYYRSTVHEKLTERMIYAYRERFIMALDGKNTKDLWNRIPGDEEDRFNTLKAAIAYIGFLPGKLMSSLLYPEKQGKYMEAMVQEINTMNHQYAALEKEDENSEAFCWVNCFQNNDCTVSFLRKTDDPEDTLLVIANFANAAREEFTIGVPEEGKYRLLFSTQEKAYGGNVSSEKPLLYAAEESWDGFPFNITTALEPLSVAVYGFVPYTEQEIFDLAEKKAEAIRLQLEEEARQKAARLKKSSLKEKLAKQVEDAEEEIAKGSEAKPKLERKQKGKKSR